VKVRYAADSESQRSVEFYANAHVWDPIHNNLSYLQNAKTASKAGSDIVA